MEPKILGRRQILTLAGSAAIASLGGSLPSPLTATESPPALLQTMFFNFNENSTPAAREQVLAGLRDLASLSMLQGMSLGKSMRAYDYPGYFEWSLMTQFATAADALAFRSHERYRAAVTDGLSPLRRNAVTCDLWASLSPGYASAAEVRVRHTVLFNFKPEASLAARNRIIDAIRTMGRLAMVQAYLVAENTTTIHQADAMQWQVIGDFASESDYQAYSDAPDHLAMRDDFVANTARVAFLDVRR